MPSVKRVVASLICSVLVFFAFFFLAYSDLYAIIEMRLYQQNVVTKIQTQLKSIANTTTQYTENLTQKFVPFVSDEAVQRVVLPIQTFDDVNQRTKLLGKLKEETYGLLGVRIVDSGGKRIHYSSFSNDILKKDNEKFSYVNYEENVDLPFLIVSSPEKNEPHVIFDSDNDQFIFSYPFIDSYRLYHGSALFYVSVSGLTRFLAAQDLISITDSIKIIGQKIHQEKKQASGIVLFLPQVGTEIFLSEIQAKWNENLFSTERIVFSEDNTLWVLFSHHIQDGTAIGSVYPESYFTLDNSVRILLIAIFFICIFFIFFMLFSLKQDAMVVIKERIRRFQFLLVEEFYHDNEIVDWRKLTEIIKEKKDDIFQDLIKSNISPKMLKKHQIEIDQLIEKNWLQILSIIDTYIPEFHLKTKETQNVQPDIALMQDILKALTEKGDIQKILQNVQNNQNLQTDENLEELEDMDEVEVLTEQEDKKEKTNLQVKGLLSRILKVEVSENNLLPFKEDSDFNDVELLDDIEELDEVSNSDLLDPVAFSEQFYASFANTNKIRLYEALKKYYELEKPLTKTQKYGLLSKIFQKDISETIKKSYKSSKAFVEFEKWISDITKNQESNDLSGDKKEMMAS